MATEVDERTDSGKLFQREGAQKLNKLFPELVLPLGTDKMIPLFDLSEGDGSVIASKDCVINWLKPFCPVGGLWYPCDWVKYSGIWNKIDMQYIYWYTVIY